jgi:putative ABC transport system ATP-binding protein
VPIVELIEVEKMHESQGDAASVHALRGVSLAVDAAKFVAVMGPSGSGKSTLLHLLGGLDTPTAGQVRIDGNDLSAFSDDQLTRFRRERVGFVFQFFNLLPSLTALENVCLPAHFAHRKLDRATTDRALGLLETMGIKDRAHHRPARMSGGEQQRVAIARALLMQPPLVLADEPTGNLDSQTGERVLELLEKACREEGATLLLVTHDPSIADRADRVVHIKDGLIATDELRAP